MSHQLPAWVLMGIPEASYHFATSVVKVEIYIIEQECQCNLHTLLSILMFVRGASEELVNVSETAVIFFEEIWPVLTNL